MHQGKGFFKIFSLVMVIAVMLAFLPANVSANPVDLSGIGRFGNKVVQIAGDVWGKLSDIKINFGSGEQPIEQLKPIKGKVVVSVAPDKDTEIKSTNGNIKLLIPKGAVSSVTNIELSELIPQGSTGKQIINQFDLVASDTATKAAVTKFNQPLQLSIQHSNKELEGLNIDSLHLYYLDEKTKQWVPVESTYDKSQKGLKATLTHFSHYGEMADLLSSGPGRVLAAQVNLHGGTANFDYSIDLPTAPGGFKPSLGLTYNSGSVDEMKNKQSVGSWVGIGWTLQPGAINCDILTKQYFLDLNGASYEVFSNDGTNYYTNPEQYLKIIRSTDGLTWDVYDRSGNHYRFGGTNSSEQYTYDTARIYYRWNLSLIEDTNGNQATITYIQDTHGTYPSDWIRSAYPEYLRYNSNLVEVHFISSYDENDGTDGYLRYDNPKTDGSNPAPKIMENRHLDSIEIKVNSTLIRKYTFVYNTVGRGDPSGDYGGIYYAGKLTLSSITQIGADGSSALPAMSFTYTNKQIYRHTSEGDYSGNPGNEASLYWPYLTAIRSGYSGNNDTISFTYTQTPNTTFNGIWTREIVTGKTINSGIGTTQSSTYTYITGSDTKPQYLGTGWDAKYRGFGEVCEIDANNNNYVKHYFFTTGTVNNQDAEKLTGREYKARWYDSSNNLLQEKIYTWDWQPTTEHQDFMTSWSNQGFMDGVVKSGIGIAVSGDDYVYSTDYDDTTSMYDRIQKFDKHGNFILKWQNSYAYNVAVSSDGYVYVTDILNDRIQKFDSSGTYIYQWGSSGSGNGQFNDAYALTVDSNGYVYVVDTGNNRIQKFSSSGGYITQWGSSGSGNGQFSMPEGIAADSANNLYVADMGNNRIQKFSSSGGYLSQWGSYGSNNGQFCCPYGIGIDGNDNIYVADTGNFRIQKFDWYNGTGRFLRKWNIPDGASKNLLPAYLAASKNTDSIYVTIQNGNIYLTRVVEFMRNWTVRLSQVDTNIGNKTSRTRYSYNGYGNVVTEFQDGDTSTTNDDATIWRAYYENTTANILDKVARERVYATAMTQDNGGTNLKKETLYYYDFDDPGDHQNYPAYTTPPTKGNLTRIENKKDSSNSINTYYKYDSYGNKTKEWDFNNNLTETTYDTTYHSYPVTKTYPITGLHEHFLYDPGTTNLLWSQNVNHTGTDDLKTYYYYDTLKRLTSVDKPDGRNPDITYEYMDWGTILQQRIVTKTYYDQNNYISQTQYFDGLGRVIQVHSSGESGHTIISSTTTFNNRGLTDKQYVSQDISQVLSAYYDTGIGNWKYSTSIYDALGRVLKQYNIDGTDVNGNYTGYDYSNPWQTNVRNSRNFITKYYYDAFEHLVKVEEPNESNGVYATTLYAYDTLGNLTQVTDNANNVTYNYYDTGGGAGANLLSRKYKMTDPDMGTWYYGYDNSGNLTSQTDAKNQTITMVYDTMNRLTNKNYPSGSGMTNTVYSYDSTTGGNYGKGLRTGMTDAAGTNSYKYDSRGRLSEEKRTVDSVDYITSYSYYSNDQIYQITYPNPSGTREVVTQEYNGRRFPNTLSGSAAGSLVTSTLYNQLGAITQINLGNGLRTNFSYWGIDHGTDSYSMLWEIKTLPQAGGTSLQDMQYTWDYCGNMTQRLNLVSSETENFTYDSLDRLTTMTGNYTRSSTNMGNSITILVSGAPQSSSDISIMVSGAYMQSYAYNTIGNITSMNGVSYTYPTNAVRPHAVTQVGSTNYSYDDNGNMNVGTARTWDAENRLTSITKDSVTTDFVYDGDGNRVKKIVRGTPDVTTLYINQYYEKNITTGIVTTSYYLGGKLIAQRENTTLRYIHQDSLSSTSVVTKSDGTLDSSITFFPFGDRLQSQGTLGTDRLFTGQRLDSTGLYYYGARYYDCTIGRFISPDTIVSEPYNPQNLNRYSYCLNNPLKYTDPSGHTVQFYGKDHNFQTLFDGWQNFMALCPMQADVMIKSETNYIIATNITTKFIENTNDFSSHIGNGQAYPNEPEFILIGSASMNQGPERVAGSILHEVLHIMDATPGDTQLEEYYAWSMSTLMTENYSGVTISGNPGGDLKSFDTWRAGLDKNSPYRILPVYSLSEDKIAKELEKIYTGMQDYKAAFKSAYGAEMYIYGSSPGSSNYQSPVYYDPYNDYYY